MRAASTAVISSRRGIDTYFNVAIRALAKNSFVLRSSRVADKVQFCLRRLTALAELARHPNLTQSGQAQ
ncbi:unnamed protein product [Echinostoma caproni]|uniref:Transposase n=1 Tax=Echinostoma caproni TaxID=27848 RepID=A0A183BA87_9TREM|nr:unnamed protein product [Echinostoma caproni]